MQSLWMSVSAEADRLSDNRINVCKHKCLYNWAVLTVIDVRFLVSLARSTKKKMKRLSLESTFGKSGKLCILKNTVYIHSYFYLYHGRT